MRIPPSSRQNWREAYWGPNLLRLQRDFIKKVANGLKISVVDTLDELKKYFPKEIWKAHHTPRGNEVVCEYLFEQGIR
jgi:hypothetical protein